MLTLHNVRKRFGNVTAVDGLSLAVRPGEVFGLLGPNGAGKTTTLSMAVGLIAPSEGTITLEGHGSPLNRAVRARIGIAPQSLALYEGLTGGENLRFFGRIAGLSGERLRTRVRAVLDEVGLADRAGDAVGGYSGGMQRRLNLAVAMLHEPPLLMLDEPTAGVDPQARHSILELVLKLRGQGRTVIYTTHYMEEAQRLCDRVAIMDHGRILALGAIDELVARHGGHSTLHLQRGEAAERLQTADPLRELSRILAGGSATLTGVQIERPSLESVFLNLTGRSLRD